MTKTLRHLLPYPVRLIGIKPKSKCNNHFKIVGYCIE